MTTNDTTRVNAEGMPTADTPSPCGIIDLIEAHRLALVELGEAANDTDPVLMKQLGRKLPRPSTAG